MDKAEDKQRLIAEQRVWLQERCRETGLDPSNLADASGLARSTLTRFANSKKVKHALSADDDEKSNGGASENGNRGSRPDR